MFTVHAYTVCFCTCDQFLLKTVRIVVFCYCLVFVNCAVQWYCRVSVTKCVCVGGGGVPIRLLDFFNLFCYTRDIIASV